MYDHATATARNKAIDDAQDALYAYAGELRDAVDSGTADESDEGVANEIDSAADGLERLKVEVPATAEVSAALRDVLAERAKQRARWGDEHDDEHVYGALGIAAAELAVDGTDAHVERPEGADRWGLVAKYGYRGTAPDGRRAIVIAAALLLAELERLDRAAKGA